MIHLPQHIDSRYRFITLAAQRCDQLMRGARPRLDTRSAKLTTLAQEEVLAGLIEERSEEPPEAAVPDVVLDVEAGATEAEEALPLRPPAAVEAAVEAAPRGE